MAVKNLNEMLNEIASLRDDLSFLVSDLKKIEELVRCVHEPVAVSALNIIGTEFQKIRLMESVVKNCYDFLKDKVEL